MSLLQLIEFLRNRLKAVLIVCYVLLALLVVVDALPVLVDKEHAHTRAEHFPAFWTLCGLRGCVLLVIVAKVLGQAFLSRREDYYDE